MARETTNNMSYQAHVMTGPKKGSDDVLEVQTRNVPTVLDCVAVLVKIKAAGVCHSDVHFWHGYYQASLVMMQ